MSPETELTETILKIINGPELDATNISKELIGKSVPLTEFLETYRLSIRNKEGNVDFLKAGSVLRTMADMYVLEVDSTFENVTKFYGELQKTLNIVKQSTAVSSQQNAGRKAITRKKYDKENEINTFENLCTPESIDGKRIIDNVTRVESNLPLLASKDGLAAYAPIVYKKNFVTPHIFKENNVTVNKRFLFIWSGYFCNTILPNDSICYPCPHVSNPVLITPQISENLNDSSIRNDEEMDISADLNDSAITAAETTDHSEHHEPDEEEDDSDDDDTADTTVLTNSQTSSDGSPAKERRLFADVLNENSLSFLCLLAPPEQFHCHVGSVGISSVFPQWREGMNRLQDRFRGNHLNLDTLLQDSKIYLESELKVGDLVLALRKSVVGIPIDLDIIEDCKNVLVCSTGKKHPEMVQEIEELLDEFLGFDNSQNESKEEEEEEADFLGFQDVPDNLPASSGRSSPRTDFSPSAEAEAETNNDEIVNYADGDNDDTAQRDRSSREETEITNGEQENRHINVAVTAEMMVEIKEWSEFIKPHIQKAVKRAQKYDVKQHSRNLISKIASVTDKPAVPLEDLVKDDWQNISCTFITLLELANKKNINILPTKTNEDELPINNMKVTLLNSSVE